LRLAQEKLGCYLKKKSQEDEMAEDGEEDEEEKRADSGSLKQSCTYMR
jgi:hypothetical protein